MGRTDEKTGTKAARRLINELQNTGHDVELADLLDCLASAGLVLAHKPDRAAQAYSEHILRSLERAA